MKPTVKDYFSLFINILVKRPAKELAKGVRYQIELGGNDGYEVNGIGNYWGRYASIEKIVELANTMKNNEDWFSFYFPAVKHNFKYSHEITIHWLETKGCVGFEFIESSSQCGSYFKSVPLLNLETEIRNLREIEKSPESHGFKYKEW